MAIKDDMEDVQEAVINELITENGITNTLADDQVTESKIASSAVTTTKIADGAIIPSKLSSAVSFAPAANSLNSGQLADNAVTRPKIADNSVSTLKLYDDAVTTPKIDDDAVTTAKIDDDAVTTAKLATGAVTASKMGAGEVGTLAIADDAVTPAKLDRAYLESDGGSVSGNVLVGKTTTAFGTEGVALRENRLQATNTGNAPLELNRLSDNGDISAFYKDGSKTGSISTRGGSTTSYITFPTSGSGAGIGGSTNMVIPVSETGAAQDDRISLGSSSTRWQDLHLSGTIILSNIPTSAPSTSGAIWSDGGTLKIVT